MADDKEQSIEEAAIQSLYRRIQTETLDRASAQVTKWGQGEGVANTDPTNTAESELTKQAGSLQAANRELEAIEMGGQYDSQASYSAAVEKGIQTKMKAMNMLDQAGEYDVTPMTAAYVDPVTGETVQSADAADFTSSAAFNRAADAQLAAGRDSKWEALSYGNRADRENKGTREDRGVTKDWYLQTFGEETGQEIYDRNKIDAQSVQKEMQKVVYQSREAGEAMARQQLEDEYEMRMSAADAQAAAYNTQQSYSAEKAKGLANEAADAQQEIRSSIESDKQSLARQGSGGSGRTAKVAVDLTQAQGNTRPI